MQPTNVRRCGFNATQYWRASGGIPAKFHNLAKGRHEHEGSRRVLREPYWQQDRL